MHYYSAPGYSLAATSFKELLGTAPRKNGHLRIRVLYFINTRQNNGRLRSPITKGEIQCLTEELKGIEHQRDRKNCTSTNQHTVRTGKNKTRR
jgi:hypothetical protein